MVTKRLDPVLVSNSQLIPGIESSIYSLRGQRVLIAQQLASLYGVEPRVLMQQVQRNIERFTADFMFQLTADEFQNLKSQFVTSSWGDLRKMPYAFTEQGVAMLSSVLRSEQAISVNIEIMRTFVKLRRVMSEHAELKSQLNALEQTYDERFRVVFEAINKLMHPAEDSKKARIGFIQD